MENTFGEFLKLKRQENNLTQKQLAKILFVSESAISKWEKDVAHPDITLLPRLSEVLGVTEHELITASIDIKDREEKVQAKKWRALSVTWELFFYIAYVLALIPCFIVNLAVNKTLSWFWIVLSALVLSFTFTNLPKYIKKYKLVLVPLSMYLALCLLLAVCCIYTSGNWFWIPTLSVFLALIMVFVPIYITKYDIFAKIRKYNDFVSVAIDFVVLNILLIVINIYTYQNGYSNILWYFTLALPITIAVYLILNVLLSVRFLKINKLLKTSIILFIINSLYFIPPFVKVDNPYVQIEIDQTNIFKANFTDWMSETTLANNIHLIVFLSIAMVFTGFLISGLLLYFKTNKNKD